jgi:ribosomal protein S18 acetylase RimI-like enzyme
MITIRNYQEDDARQVGILIADTYTEFNLGFASAEEQPSLLGPFQHARSSDQVHQKQIADTIQSEIVLVAEDSRKIVGVLRGRKERLASLFVHKDYHRQGIGRKLVDQFERESLNQDVALVKVAATLYAVPFYKKMGYQESGEIKTSWSFDGYGLQHQPMIKLLKVK